jgi:polyhydroxyalkanoate synthesis repressor PhaR
MSTAPPAGETGNDPAAQVRVLKKYPNRRLYDTRSSSYITLADVKQMVLQGEAFEVRDARSGADLTRAILLQIILEEETAGMPIFSTPMLAQLIRFYGHAMQGMMGSFLEKNLQAFVDWQHRLGAQGLGPFDPAAYKPDAWAQMLQGQAPLMQNLMGSYLEQTRSVMTQMQEQMRKASGDLMGGFGSRPPKG